MADQDILNFALNLEYLETEFYSRALGGGTMAQAGAMPGASVMGARAVRFSSPETRAIAEHLLANESAHVRFLRRTLGSAAIPMPALDFAGGFAGVAQAAGLPRNFDPFSDETSFFLASFLFEDTGVTAYNGAAPLIQSKDILQAAAAIHAVEAYHMGTVRSILYRRGQSAIAATQAISNLRRRLGDGPTEQPVAGPRGEPNIVPADENGIVRGRTAQQVLNIVYGTPGPGVTRGGFFPSGMNGSIRST